MFGPQDVEPKDVESTDVICCEISRRVKHWRHEITYSTMKKNHGSENCS